MSSLDTNLAHEVLPERQNPFLLFARRLLGNRAFVIGGTLFLIVLLLAVFADQIAPYKPNANNFRARLEAPSALHWFGTDHFGRDILSRAIHGGRLSLFIGLSVVLFTGVVGTRIGGAARDFRRRGTMLLR